MLRLQGGHNGALLVKRTRQIRPRQSLEEPVHIDYDVDKNTFDLEPDGDNYAILVDRLVAVTPMSVDFTSRVTLSELEGLLRK